MGVWWCVLTLMVATWSCVESGGDAGMKAFADMLDKWKAEEKASAATQSILEETGTIHRGNGTTLIPANKKVLVDKHNSLRRNEPDQANMEMLKWNDYLASMADDWARACMWKHGQPDRNPATWPFQTFGQNLYATTDDVIDLENAVQNWYDERDYYDYGTKSCNPPPGRAHTCGHYTQVTWSSTRELGCAVAECPRLEQPLPGRPLWKALYMVCNYGPAGNIVDPYTGSVGFNYLKGPPCSRCESGCAWCTDKLCSGNCSQAESGCSCPLKCVHGRLQTSTCRCECDPGWSQTNCSEPCVETEPRCKRGWRKSYCTDPRYSRLFQQKCPILCNICQGSPGGLNKIRSKRSSVDERSMEQVKRKSNDDATNDEDSKPVDGSENSKNVKNYRNEVKENKANERDSNKEQKPNEDQGSRNSELLSVKSGTSDQRSAASNATYTREKR